MGICSLSVGIRGHRERSELCYVLSGQGSKENAPDPKPHTAYLQSCAHPTILQQLPPHQHFDLATCAPKLLDTNSRSNTSLATRSHTQQTHRTTPRTAGGRHNTRTRVAFECSHATPANSQHIEANTGRERQYYTKAPRAMQPTCNTITLIVNRGREVNID